MVLPERVLSQSILPSFLLATVSDQCEDLTDGLSAAADP